MNHLTPASKTPTGPRAHRPAGPARTTRADRAGPRRVRLLAAVLATGTLLALVPTAQAQECNAPGMNGQCTEFGRIAMESQRDIRGSAIDLTVSFTLDTVFTDQGSRWLLVSVRNEEADGSDPVTIELVRFGSEYGEVLTTRVEHPSAHELNLWVETLDTPVGTPLTLDLKVGSTERGAFRLETLVMAFDRGYAPVKDASGNDASLFAFTLLGVNKESGEVASDKGSLLRGNKVPALGASVLLGALLGCALLARRLRA